MSSLYRDNIINIIEAHECTTLDEDGRCECPWILELREALEHDRRNDLKGGENI